MCDMLLLVFTSSRQSKLSNHEDHVCHDIIQHTISGAFRNVLCTEQIPWKTSSFGRRCMHFALIQVRVIQFEGRGDDHHRGHRSRSARHGEGSPAPKFNCFPQHITCSFLLLAAGGGRRGLGDLAPSMKCEISADHCSRIQGGSKGRRRKEKDGRDDDRVDELGGQLGWQNMFRDSAKMFLQLRGRRCCSLGSLRRLCHALECCSHKRQ